MPPEAPPKLLIVNADDYGMTPGVNAGIVEGHHRGIVTSTTIMACGPALADGVARLRDAPGLATGCHLTLIGAEPVAPLGDVRSLVDGSGRFPRTLGALLGRFLTGGVRHAELVTELAAQIERLRTAGVVLSHCDSHKHSHVLPQVLDAVLEVAERYRIPCLRKPFEHQGFSALAVLARRQGEQRALVKRNLVTRLVNRFEPVWVRRLGRSGLRCPDHFHGFVATGRIEARLMPLVLDALEPGVNELMCHPARLDTDLAASATRLKMARVRELAALVSDDARAALGQCGVRLISFTDLATLTRG